LRFSPTSPTSFSRAAFRASRYFRRTGGIHVHPVDDHGQARNLQFGLRLLEFRFFPCSRPIQGFKIALMVLTFFSAFSICPGTVFSTFRKFDGGKD
jgi:hypothetical protein